MAKSDFDVSESRHLTGKKAVNSQLMPDEGKIANLIDYIQAKLNGETAKQATTRLGKQTIVDLDSLIADLSGGWLRAYLERGTLPRADELRPQILRVREHLKEQSMAQAQELINLVAEGSTVVAAGRKLGLTQDQAHGIARRIVSGAIDCPADKRHLFGAKEKRGLERREKALDMARLRANGWEMPDIARHFGVAPAAAHDMVQQIVSGKYRAPRELVEKLRAQRLERKRRSSTKADPTFKLPACFQIGSRTPIAGADMGVNQCWWPIGDPRDGPYGYCGDATDDGQRYCPAHHALAHAPKKVRT